MEAAAIAKPRRGAPPIPPNHISLRQLQELRLKEEERQREEAARKAEMEAMAAAVVKRDAARKPKTKVSAFVSVTPVRAKERCNGGLGPQWVDVAHHPAVPPPPRGEGVLGTIGVGRGNKGPANAPRYGGKLVGKAEGDGKSAITSAQARTDEPGKPAEASSHGGKPENKGERKRKTKEKSSGDTSAHPGSIGESGGSAGASSRRRNNPNGKKGAGGRSAESNPAGASPTQGVKPENAGKPKSTWPKRAGASPVSDSSHGKKADARPAPPTSAAAGSVGEPRTTAETKPEALLEGHRRPPLLENQGVAEQKPQVFRRRAWPRPAGDRCNRAGEQHGASVGAEGSGGWAEL